MPDRLRDERPGPRRSTAEARSGRLEVSFELGRDMLDNDCTLIRATLAEKSIMTGSTEQVRHTRAPVVTYESRFRRVRANDCYVKNASRNRAASLATAGRGNSRATECSGRRRGVGQVRSPQRVVRRPRLDASSVERRVAAQRCTCAASPRMTPLVRAMRPNVSRSSGVAARAGLKGRDERP
jgi:hypothetical protein